MRILKLSLIGLFLIGCVRTESELTDTKKELIAEGVTESMQSYMAAINAEDVEAVITHYESDSQFSVVSDGQFFSFDEWVSGVRTQWASINEAAGDWGRIAITVLDQDVALAFAPYHLTFTDTAGASISHNGVVTWVWVKRGDTWKMIHGHTRNEPMESHKLY
ncbi:DUF4440 domain-containing protein [Aliifodinibius sp. S!AR15-10]|uniref:YybH family protein n=1 Tax=Aliifodinibius sp. S!AR15-10 TaxID=2950437 RepID=UPI002866F934|nr:DUF4440 domain-containing protein [Aliifodinibius sp. S!AR15-10]MDR8394431.1 DUF4440 domain-containing protein [Aliifodinibius sp. S!AR15-10]